MGYIRALLFWTGVVLITPPYALFCLFLFPLPPLFRHRIVNGWTQMMLGWIRLTCKLGYTVRGVENIPKRPAIVMSKHQSAWETFALQHIFPPLTFVIKKELLSIPFFGWGLAVTSPIAINRSRPLHALSRLIQEGADRVRKGFWILIFPEGQRTAPGETGHYKLGGARLALALSLPIVPVALNSGECWPKGRFCKWPGTITVSIGPPILTTGRSATAIVEDVKTWIESEMQRLPNPRRGDL